MVAIIALLVAILIPSLTTARKQAHSTVCLGFLEQQGKAAFMYAHETKGWFPSCQYDAIERIPKATRRLLTRMTSKEAQIYYCPSNEIRPWTVKNFELNYPDAANEGRILYWWVANPHPDQASRFLDLDDDGTNKDEYITKVEQRDCYRFALSTDQSRQMAAGWYFFHGRGQGLQPNVTDTKGLVDSWKNTVYGDGHAESVKAFRVIARWGLSNYAGW
ncbi:MAG: hypothetical protein HY718_04615 [Planctomycetes bacterium]|nr:hypothetical protein [Planctomycetota bacterium]